MYLLWGIPYLFIKVAAGGVSVPVVVFARTAIGAVLLLPLALSLLYGPRALDFYGTLFGEPARHFDFTWLRAYPPDPMALL